MWFGDQNDPYIHRAQPVKIHYQTWRFCKEGEELSLVLLCHLSFFLSKLHKFKISYNEVKAQYNPFKQVKNTVKASKLIKNIVVVLWPYPDGITVLKGLFYVAVVP